MEWHHHKKMNKGFIKLASVKSLKTAWLFIVFIFSNIMVKTFFQEQLRLI